MESDVVTLQDIFVAKPPEEDSRRRERTRSCSCHSAARASSPTSSRRWPLQRRRAPADVLRARTTSSSTPNVRRRVRPMSWKRSRIAASGSASSSVSRALVAVPAAGAGVKRLRVSTRRPFPRIRMTVVTSQPSSKVAGVEGERPAGQQGYRAENLGGGKERRARRRPLAVDARRALRRRGRGCTARSSGPSTASDRVAIADVRHQSTCMLTGFSSAAGRRTERARLTERRRRRRDDALRRDRQVGQVVRRRGEQRPSRHRGDRRQRDAKHRHARERDPRCPRGRRPRLRRRDREPPVQSCAAEATRPRYGR